MTRNSWQLSAPLSTGAYFWKAPCTPSRYSPTIATWNTGRSPALSIAATLNGTYFLLVTTSKLCTAQTMLPDPVFANIAMVTPEKEIQRQIETALDQDKSLEEILQFLQNKSKAPPSIKRAFKDYQMEAGLLFYQG
ncbi:hypothetical protein RhiTH_008985 [Rhizoctonia solani]